MPNPYRDLSDHGLIAFARDLARTPSMSGTEGAAVELTAFELQRLGFDQVEIDEAGNCVGIVGAPAGDALWQAIDAGLVTSVASDHSPCLPEMKKADPPWAGVASLGLSLSLLVSAPELSGRPEMAVALLTGARSFLGLPGKGELRRGADADIVLVEPDAEWRVDAAAVHHRHPATNPYLGRTLRSRVRTTFLRGQVIYDCEAGFSPARGRWIRRASNASSS